MPQIIEIAEALRGQGIQSSTHSLGDGMWSIELHTESGFLTEFVGHNGSREEEPTDLWAQVDAAIKAAEGYNTAMFGGGYIAK